MNKSASTKARWRALLRSERAVLTARERARAAEELTARVAEADLGAVVAAYVPVGAEPGSVSMLDALHAQVLLPITPAEPGPLNWARYRPGALTPGRFDLPEPTGPLLGSAAIRTADTVLLPALGVDRRGARLGRGAGFYDRSLDGAGGKLIAVVYTRELVDELPADPWDVPVHGALTPDGLIWF